MTAQIEALLLENQQLRAEIKTRDVRFRALIDQNADGILVVDQDGGVRFANPAAEELFQIAADQWLDQPFGFPVVPGQATEVDISRGFGAGSTLVAEMRATEVVWEGKPAYVVSLRDISERKRAEDALRASERRYQDLFDSMLNGFALHEIICDEHNQPVDYRFLKVNPAFEKLTGLSAQQVVGRTVREVLPHAVETWIATYGQVALTCQPVHFTQYSAPLERIYEVVAFCPERGRFATIFADVTDRVRAEEALRASEERFRTVVTSTDDVIFTLDREHRHTGVFGRWVQDAGLTPDWFLGRTTGEIFGPEAALPHEAANNRALAGESVVYEWHLPSAEGMVYYQTALSPLRGPDGSVVGLVGVGRNITPLKEAAAELLRSETKFRLLVAESSDAIALTDEEGRVIEWNAAAAQLFGIKPADVIGNYIWDVQMQVAQPEVRTEARYQQLRALTQQALATGQSPILNTIRETELWRSDQAPAVIQTQAFPIPSGSGFMLGSISRDVTEKKRAEEALQAYSNRLEAMVAERTEALEAAHAAMLRQDRLAVLGQLSGGIAHELRQPLAVLRAGAGMLTELLAEEPTDVEELLETAEAIDLQVMACNRIIGTLLDFASPKPPVPQTLDLHQFLAEMLAQANLGGAIQVCTRFEAEPATLVADADQLQLVINNLLHNAAQAMPHGGRLTVATALEPAGEVMVSVADTGVGIDPQDLPQIFEPLFTRKRRGVGLGLALCKLFVEAHNGRIAVQSTPGQGATFTIHLPRQ